jgi:hypothetical protein
MKKPFIAAVAAVGLGLWLTAAAPAQTTTVNPVTGQTTVQYYTPYTYGSNSFYTYPNTGYAYQYPNSTYIYPNVRNNNYVGPTVYGPGYTANYPYMYNQYNYGYTSPYSTYNYSYPSYTRTYRWWR